MTLQTEYKFSLPQGFIDVDGQPQREGVMRLATAYDEIAPMKDPRVQANPGYLTIILLSRVVTRLGDVSPINPKTIEQLFAGDLAYLQDLYRKINYGGGTQLSVTCPHCEASFAFEGTSAGES